MIAFHRTSAEESREKLPQTEKSERFVTFILYRITFTFVRRLDATTMDTIRNLFPSFPSLLLFNVELPNLLRWHAIAIHKGFNIEMGKGVV